MDLRNHLGSDADVEKFISIVTGYQPFILSDTVQTGMAYFWTRDSHIDAIKPRSMRHLWESLVLRKDNATVGQWSRFTEANAMYRNMCESWIEAICSQFAPGERANFSVIDIGSNNCYFPIRLQQEGFGSCTGVDVGNFTKAVDHLNSLLGTKVEYINAPYDSMSHNIQGIDGQWDIVICTAFMNHVSDPLYFLKYLSTLSARMLFLWTDVLDTQEFIVKYDHQNVTYYPAQFPACFNAGTRISYGLLEKSLNLCGFDKIIAVESKGDVLPADSYVGRFRPLLCIKSQPAESEKQR